MKNALSLRNGLLVSTLLLGCIFYFSTASFTREAIAESYVAYKDGRRTEVRGMISGRVLASGTDAAPVLQKGLDQLSARGGGGLRIEAGDYQIDTPLELPSGVQLSGAGRATVLRLSAQNREGVVLRASGKEHLSIEQLSLRGDRRGDTLSTGLLFDAVGLSTVDRVYAAEFGGVGIWVRNHSFANQLRGNYTSRNGRAGTLIQDTDKSRGGRFVPNQLNGCYSYNETGHGFEFDRAICQDIVGCVAYLAGGHGIYMHDGTSNLITGNRVFMSQGDGVRLQDNYEMNVSANVVGWNWGDNLTMDHVVWATVTGNEFIDAGGRVRPGYGIYMKRGCKAVQISANAIFNWWDNQILSAGIYEGDDCFDNQITDNVINYYRDEDVVSLGRRTVTGNNLGLPNPYAWPKIGPDAPDVKPEDIKLNLHINESKKLAEQYLEDLKKPMR